MNNDDEIDYDKIPQEITEIDIYTRIDFGWVEEGTHIYYPDSNEYYERRYDILKNRIYYFERIGIIDINNSIFTILDKFLENASDMAINYLLNDSFPSFRDYFEYINGYVQCLCDIENRK